MPFTDTLTARAPKLLFRWHHCRADRAGGAFSGMVPAAFPEAGCHRRYLGTGWRARQRKLSTPRVQWATGMSLDSCGLLEAPRTGLWGMGCGSQDLICGPSTKRYSRLFFVQVPRHHRAAGRTYWFLRVRVPGLQIQRRGRSNVYRRRGGPFWFAWGWKGVYCFSSCPARWGNGIACVDAAVCWLC